MRLGQLRHQVVIQQASRSSDGQGGGTMSWTTLATVWARIEPVAGREVVAQQGLQSQITHRVVMRFRSDVTTKMRLSHDGRLMNIRSIRNLEERKRWMELSVEEGVAT